MNRRELVLERAKIDCAQFNKVSKETLRLYTETRVSATSFEHACQEGQNIYDKRLEDAGYWQAAKRDDAAREAIRRHLSCGDRLDTAEGVALILELHTAKDEKNAIAKRLEIA